MFDKYDHLKLEYLDGHYWLLLEDFEYVSENKGWTVEVWTGFTTDFASIPRALWSLLPPTGKWGRAAVIHDWLYATAFAIDEDGKPVEVSRADADAIFREACGDLGVSWTLRWLMWSGVRVGGGAAWKRYRNDEKVGPER
jgi:hypothetical protein